MDTGNRNDGESAPIPTRTPWDRDPGFAWLADPSLPRQTELASTTPVLLFSGGIDSVCIWHLTGKPVALYFSTGAPWERDELDALKELRNEVRGLMSKFYPVTWTENISSGIEPDGHIPYRNLWLVLHAASLGFNDITLGALAGETSRDKSLRFARDAGALLSYLEQRHVTVRLPFRSMTKAQLVRKFIDEVGRSYAKSVLAMTQSCYNIGHELDGSTGLAGCGDCLACLRRWIAMEANGIHETYYHDPRAFAFRLTQGGETLDAVKKYGTRVRNPVEMIGVLKNQWDLWRALHG